MFHGLADVVAQGGWGFAALALVGIGYMYVLHRREIQKMQDDNREHLRVMEASYHQRQDDHESRAGDALDRRYADVVDIVRVSTDVISSTRDLLTRMESEIRLLRNENTELRHKVESMSTIIQRCEKQ